MTEQLEHELRHLFAEDAERAPAATDLAAGALRRVRRRRNTRLAWAAGALVAASLATVALLGGGLLGGQPTGVVSPPTVAPQGPLPDGGSASCVEQYSPAAVNGRSFAFDGTVTAIGPGRSDRADTGLDLVAATFTVNEWFEGGSGSAVTVDITPPDAAPSSGASAPAYEVGTRLLVSGEPRWGGAPLTDAIAWGCGFTRYYDEETASSWRAASR